MQFILVGVREMNEEEIQESEKERMFALPILEVICDQCNGLGKVKWCSDEDCSECKGAGYKPTEEGKVILELISHNLRNRRSLVSLRN